MKNIEKFEELAKLTAICNRNTKHLIKELGLWQSHGYGDDPNQFRLLASEMVKYFPKSNIKVTESNNVGYPYNLSVKVHAIEITALLSQADFEKYYPELIETEIDRLEKQLAALKGGSDQ